MNIFASYKIITHSKVLFLLLLTLLISPVKGDAQIVGMRLVDSAKRHAQLVHQNDSAFMYTSFYIADVYMDMDQYDSAQIWLNQVAERVSLRKPTYFNFYLSINQAITYYFNGLQQMGLQEGERGIDISRVLNDSLCIATACNVTGVFYMNSGQLDKAIHRLKHGIPYARQPPYTPNYIVVSKPHNLYGNLGEAYLKKGMTDSAFKYASRSLQLAEEMHSYRGIAVAYNLLGLIATRREQWKEGLLYQQKAAELGLKFNNADVALIAHAGIAKCLLQLKAYDSAQFYLEKGFELLKADRYINGLFKGLFLDETIQILSGTNNVSLKMRAMEQRTQLGMELMRRYDAQVAILLKANVNNEIRAAKMELVAANRKQAITNSRLLIASILLVCVTIVLFMLRHYHKRQLREINIRNKISRDLHDDIGSTLSSIQLYSDMATTIFDDMPQKSKEMVQKINAQSKELMNEMSDVIWSLRTTADDKNSIVSRITNYSMDLLAVKGINCILQLDEAVSSQLKNPIVRKNILLIAKEAMNNIAKYSACTECTISLKRTNNMVTLCITDNGKGISKQTTSQGGNGLRNMQLRCEEINGKWTLRSATNQGTTVICDFPIAIISHPD